MNEYKIYIDLSSIIMDTDGSPHNPIADAMFSNLTMFNRDKLMEDVKELKRHKKASKVVADVKIEFQLEGKYLHIKYSPPEDKSISEHINYKALDNNNEPNLELYTAIARAEVNANMLEYSDDFELQSFPGVGYYLSRTSRYKPNTILRHYYKMWKFGMFSRKPRF